MVKKPLPGRVFAVRLLFCAAVFLAAGPAAGAAGPDNRPVLEKREYLLEIFRRDGAAAVPALTAALADDAELVRRTAAHLLVRLGPPALAGLEKGLENPDFLLRRIIIRGLADMGLLLDHWGAVIRDAHPSIMRETRVYWLEKQVRPLTGENRARIIAEFDRAYRDSPAPVRRNIVEMLATLAPGDDGARQVLARATRDADEEIRQIAFRVIAAPDLARLRELAGGRKWRELADAFGGEDFAAWPDRALAREAFFLRGRAFYELKDGAKAQSDLEQSVALSPDRQALLLLGDNFRQNLNDRPKALESYVRAVETTAGQGGSLLYTSILTAAGHLREDGRHDEALAMLERARPDTMTGYWGAQMLLAAGRTLAEQGRNNEARARYRQALALEGINPAQQTALENALKALAPGG